MRTSAIIPDSVYTLSLKAREVSRWGVLHYKTVATDNFIQVSVDPSSTSFAMTVVGFFNIDASSTVGLSLDGNTLMSIPAVGTGNGHFSAVIYGCGPNMLCEYTFQNTDGANTSGITKVAKIHFPSNPMALRLAGPFGTAANDTAFLVLGGGV